MKRAVRHIRFAVCLLPILFVPSVLWGAVQVVEDEVIFSLNAPGAGRVFLVGDFNNWNPTLEKMDETDGNFTVYLFLLPGTYRYKFVVDGEWLADPDNPPDDESQGSLLVLEERAGMLTFGDEEVVQVEGGPLLQPSLRYDGKFWLDDNRTGAEQILDVFVHHKSKRVSAMVDLRTTDDTWNVSPLSAEINFDRGYVDLFLGETTLRGFENDTIWTSSDPFDLVGQVGVFDYNAGYERQGFSLEVPLPLNIEFKTFFADKIEERPGPPPRVESSVFDDFVQSGSADTTVYRYGSGFEDEDTWGIEFVADAGSVKLGYVRRWNLGFHPGLLGKVVAEEPLFVNAAATTREFWDADVFWLRWRFLSRFAAVVGVARSDGEIRAEAGSVSFAPGPGDMTVGQATVPIDHTIPMQTNKRWKGALEYENARLRAGLRYEWSEYDFEAGVYAPAQATINVADLDASYETESWRTAGRLRYLDQDYGQTPDDFHYFTPARNFWLDYRDRLTVDNMVAFDLETSTQLSANVSYGVRMFSTLTDRTASTPTSVRVDAGLTTDGFFKRIEYGYLRFGIEHMFPKRFFAQWDSRLAGYNKSSWGFKDTFFSTYLEGGYRIGWGEFSLGVGLDPVVLDRVRGAFGDIGREEYLREAIPERLSRSESDLLGSRLRDREESLRDIWALTLEVVLFF